MTRLRRDTTLARIIHLVETAQAQRAPTQQFIDRFARWYTPAVIGLAIVVAVVPPLAGASFETGSIARWCCWWSSCPCALVISTPVSIVSALAGAARRGVLSRVASTSSGSRRAALAFDKTGTLTRAALQVTAIHPGARRRRRASCSARRGDRSALGTSNRGGHRRGRARARDSTVRPASDVRACPGWAPKGASRPPDRLRQRPHCSSAAACWTTDARRMADAVAHSGASPVLVVRDRRGHRRHRGVRSAA